MKYCEKLQKPLIEIDEDDCPLFCGNCNEMSEREEVEVKEPEWVWRK